MLIVADVQTHAMKIHITTLFTVAKLGG